MRLGRKYYRLGGRRSKWLAVFGCLLFALLCAATLATPAQASSLFDIESLTQMKEVGALTLFFLLAAATLVSEDATCIAAGALAAQGRAGFALAAGGCLFGIFVGDLLLFLAGRALGRPALRFAPMKWLVRPTDVERSSEWFSRKGMSVILISRFLPGTRLPTYFAAGLLETSSLKFSLYFFLAAAAWTPLLVGISMTLGAQALDTSLLAGYGAWVKLLAGGALAFVTVKLLVRLSSFRGRRLLVSRLRRIARWEFWPPYIFYPPVVLYVALLALKYRSLTLFTCANPAIPGGGFVGESKIEILRALSSSEWSRERVAPAMRLGSQLRCDARMRDARSFMAEQSLGFPIVLKPDAGQRGEGVAVVRCEAELEDYLRREPHDTIIQEYVAGLEFGIFYYRLPNEERGQIFSVTEKRFPQVVGDGASTLEELILKDARAVPMACAYFERNASRLGDVPAAGEHVTLVEIGSHCRGAIFLDGARLKTDALEAAFNRLSKAFDGFYFGRYDIRTPSLEDFQRGENFKVIELNGVTSEATHIYDPANNLLKAYRVLFRQWRLAFQIGARNRARGVEPTTLGALLKMVWRNFVQSGEAALDVEAVRGNNICAPRI
ncbi:MAG: VTT domain-containing protein [Rubrivivax sp.]|nr:VTT domain-containing protein [Pyrinomonadaceae bacterium]